MADRVSRALRQEADVRRNHEFFNGRNAARTPLSTAGHNRPDAYSPEPTLKWRLYSGTCRRAESHYVGDTASGAIGMGDRFANSNRPIGRLLWRIPVDSFHGLNTYFASPCETLLRQVAGGVPSHSRKARVKAFALA